MSKRRDGISITFIPFKSAPAAAVTVSFPAPNLNWFVLQKLKAEKPCGCATLAHASEYTALVYSMYDDIRDMFIGSPDRQMKSKVASVTCGFNGGEFIISYVCQGSITAVRKSLGILISRLAPHKLYPRYTKYIKLLGGSPKRGEFLNCANRIASARDVSVVVVAKMNVDKSKETNVLETVSKRLPDVGGIPSGDKPMSESTPPGATEYHEINVKDAAMLFVQDFLDASNVLSLSTGNSIIIYEKKWNGVKEDAVERYVTSRFGKLGDNMIPVLVYSACSRGILKSSTLRKLASSNMNKNDIVKSIESTLK